MTHFNVNSLISIPKNLFLRQTEGKYSQSDENYYIYTQNIINLTKNLIITSISIKKFVNDIFRTCVRAWAYSRL